MDGEISSMDGEMSSMDESVTCGWRQRMTDMDGAKVTSSTASKFSDGDGSLKFFLTLIIFPYDRFPPPFVLYHFFCCWYEAFFLSTMYAIEKSYFLFVCSANICNGSSVQNYILG